MAARRLVSLLIGLWLALAPLGAQALDLHTEEDYALPAGATVDGDLFVNGVVVRIDGHVRGDLYVAATFIDVAGQVDGDVIAFGREMDVRGPVGGNVRAGGGTLNLSSPVARNVSAAVGVLRIGSGARIGGSVLAWVRDEPLVIGEQAAVAGPVDYWSDLEARVAAGARTGLVQRHEPPRMGLGPRASATARAVAGVAWLLWVSGTGVAAGVVVWARGGALTLALSQRERGRRIVASGLIGLVAPPVLLPLLGLTIVGLPLAFGLGALWVFGLWLAWLVAGQIVGKAVARRAPWPVGRVRAAVGGTLLLGVLASLPYVGPLIAVAALVVGFGRLAEARRRAWP